MEIIRTGEEKGAIIVAVNGKLDAVTAPDFEKTFSGWINEGATRFIVDFGELTYISSGGFRSILIVTKKLKETGGKIFLYGLKPAIKKVFDISGFSVMVPIYETKESALAAI